MQKLNLKPRKRAFTLPTSVQMDAALAVPTVKGSGLLKYGRHAYYLMNFQTGKGLNVSIGHLDIIRPGWKRLRTSAEAGGQQLSLRNLFSAKYHYGFNLLEQVMLMTVPHTATPLGDGKFIINLWSWFGCILIDVKQETASYYLMEDLPDQHVLGSQQWFDAKSGDLYAMSYVLKDSLGRIRDPGHAVPFRVFKHRLDADGTDTVWEGELADYMHDIQLNATMQYGVVCELGMYKNQSDKMLPSKVLVFDLQNKRHWILEEFIVAAHACFDPVEPNVVYFSNHNFEFEHSDMVTLLKKGSYSVRFHGPAAIYKYELTPDGPKQLGVYTQEDFFRLTNMHVFLHRGRKMIVAMGFPDVVFLIDAADMRFIRKIVVKDPVSINHLYSRKPSLIGTIALSPDGDQLFVHTTRSFQVVDIDSGEPLFMRDCFRHHTCFNHMAVSTDVNW